MSPLPDASSGRGRRRPKVGAGSPASEARPTLINSLPRDQSADEEAVNAGEEGGTTICPLRDGSSRDGQWGDDSDSHRGDRDDEDEGRGRARSPSGNDGDDGPPLLLLDDVSAFKSDAAISWRPCRGRLKAVQEEEKDKQNNFRGVLRKKVKVKDGVEQERRPNRKEERTERRGGVRFGACAGVVARYLTLVTLVMRLPVGAEGVGVAHRSLLNTGNPDAKRLYDDLLSNYNKLVRPVVNTTDPLTVRIKLKLSQLIDVVRDRERHFLPLRVVVVVVVGIIDSISATTATMSKLWRGGGEDTVTSVMIGTQLRHVRSFIIDGWLFSSLPLLHTCSPQWRVGFGRGPGQIAAARQASSNLVVELQAQLLKPWRRRAGGGVNDVALALLLDRRAAADTCSDKSDIRYMTKTPRP